MLLVGPASVRGEFPRTEAFTAGADAFESAPEIVSASGVSDITDLLAFSKETGETGHSIFSNNTAGKSAWWRWTAPETGFCTVDTGLTPNVTAPVKDTVLAVYQGESLETLTPVVKNNDRTANRNDPDRRLSSVSFFATAGEVYLIAVDGLNSSFVVAGASEVRLQIRQVAARKAVRFGTWVAENRSGDAVDMGSVAVTLTGTGGLSGKLTTMKKVYPFKGVVSTDGHFRAAFEQPVKKGEAPRAPVELLLDVTAHGLLRVNVDGVEAGATLPERAVFAPKVPSSNAGYYTLHVSVNTVVVGYGTMGMSVAGSGAVRGTGVAPDGSVFTFGSALHQSRADDRLELSLFAPMFAKKGGIMLSGTVSETGVNDNVEIEGFFIRPAGAATATFYPEGLNENVSAYGGTYTAPGKVGRVLGFMDGDDGAGVLRITNRNDELPDGSLTERLIWGETNKIVFDSPTRKPVLKLNPKTGMITGSITEPANRKRTIRGAIILNSGFVGLEGLVTGAKQTLFFDLGPVRR